MVVMVQTGRLSRGEAVRRLRAHLRRAIQQDDHDRATCLVHELSYLKPREALDDIVKAFERHLVDEFLITLDDVNFLIESEPESRCAGRSPYVENTVEELRSWGWRNPSDEADKDNGWGNSRRGSRGRLSADRTRPEGNSPGRAQRPLPLRQRQEIQEMLHAPAMNRQSPGGALPRAQGTVGPVPQGERKARTCATHHRRPAMRVTAISHPASCPLSTENFLLIGFNIRHSPCAP